MFEQIGLLLILFILSVVCFYAPLINFRDLFMSLEDSKNEINEKMIGLQATVISWDSLNGHVRVNGEIWRAVSKEPLDLKSDDTVLITEVDKLLVTVAR